MLDVPEGTHTLIITRDKFRTLEQEVTITANGEHDLGQVTLQRMKGSATGKALLEGLEDHSYTYLNLVGTMWGAFTAPSGNYEISDVPTGIYNVMASRPGFESFTSGVIEITDQKATPVPLITLKSQHRVFGRVHGQGTQLDQDQEGTLIKIQGTDRMATTDIDGSFVMEDVPSGTFNLLVSRPGFQTLQQELIITNEEEVDLEEIPLSSRSKDGRTLTSPC